MKLTQEHKEYWEEQLKQVQWALKTGAPTPESMRDFFDEMLQEAQEQLEESKTKQKALDELGKHLMSLDVDSWEMIGDGGFKLVVGYEEEPEIIPTMDVEEFLKGSVETFEMDGKTYKVVPATSTCEGCSIENSSSKSDSLILGQSGSNDSKTFQSWESRRFEKTSMHWLRVRREKSKFLKIERVGPRGNH